MKDSLRAHKLGFFSYKHTLNQLTLSYFCQQMPGHIYGPKTLPADIRQNFTEY